MPEREARTYEEIALKPEVVQRGIHLVAPLARILLRRAKTVKGFHGRTTAAEWDAFEKDFNITIPADYKQLTNTVGTTDGTSAWPVVQMLLETPLEHNGGIHPCTTTEALYGDVIDNNGMAEYEVDSDEEEEGEKDEDKNNLKYPFEYLMIKKRNVYSFDRNLEGGKVNVEASDLGDIGEVDSEQDKKDMAMLDDVSDFEIIEDVTEKCTIMAPLTVEPMKKEPTKKKRKKKN
ncbi:unknown protein [Seminavis robusta]|uniref:Uncharacterized protein n=1 Tax=Seminavis robusta TaxID=568900 RepID=A0A9N8E5T6_9STRA|nr:unknown protein [Seminavis robusta]|eukprot:Sro692_g188160.1 n/a (233) ;mRNA; f:44146-45070